MSDNDRQTGLRGRGARPADAGPALRSRGFLSQAGAPVDDAGEKRARARGMRAHVGMDARAPRELDPAKPRRPYRMGDT